MWIIWGCYFKVLVLEGIESYYYKGKLELLVFFYLKDGKVFFYLKDGKVFFYLKDEKVFFYFKDEKV